MKRETRLLMALCASLALPGTLLAQDGEEDEGSCSVCEFEAEEITGSVQNYQDFLRRMADAEVPLREYTQDSLRSIEIGSAQALRDFSRWYRYRIAEQNADELQNRMIARFVQQGLELGLNYFLPGSGAVASSIRQYGVQAYSTIVGQLPDGTTDPGPHLERISERLETNNEGRENFMIDMFQRMGEQALRDQMDMIKMEYVWEKDEQRATGHADAGSRTPGGATRQLLREIGIGPGGTQTSAGVRQQVLTRLMRDVLCAEATGNPIFNCEQDLWYYDIASRAAAMRLVLTGDPARMHPLTQAAHLDQVCPLENGYTAIQMSADCRQWRYE